MQPVKFRSATANDVSELSIALAQLSHDIGDPYRAREESLAVALFGPCPSAWAHLAERDGHLAGVVLFSPVYSTAQGGPGVFVSDLWVDAGARSLGLGQALLRHAAQRSADLWGAEFMRLVVHNDNDGAAAFYRKLGFAAAAGQSSLALTGHRFHALGEQHESHS